MKQTIVTLIFCMAMQILFAQIEDSQIDVYQNTVIAKSGLRMRSKPSLEGEKILTIPFGKVVKITSDKSFGRLKKDGKTSQDKNVLDAIDFLGDWVKVSYDGKVGYVCNAFLFYEAGEVTIEEEKRREVNQDFILLSTDGSCFSNIYDQKGKNWYGFNATDVPSKYILTPTKFEYETAYLDGPGRYMLLIGTEPNARFIVGSKTPMKEITITNDVEEDFRLADEMEEKNKAVLSKHGLKATAHSTETGLFQLELERNGKKQVLTRNEEKPFNDGTSILWAGDIDGDGKSDFIIGFGEETHEIILFLSSKAKDGQLVKPVGIWYSGYCC